MKFTMYEKEGKNEKYRNDPYRAVNFTINESGLPVCPNGKEFHFIYSRPVRGNKYGRTEEYFQCEDCSGCPHKEKCCKCKGNRIVRLNEELTQFHAEVLNNLNSIHGALLRMNRSIQSEGTFGTIKWNRSYIRARRRGLKSLFLEFGVISCRLVRHTLFFGSCFFFAASTSPSFLRMVARASVLSYFTAPFVIYFAYFEVAKVDNPDNDLDL